MVLGDPPAAAVQGSAARLRDADVPKNVAVSARKGDMRTYLGVFLIAFSSLAFEVSLSRLLSVVTWYHLAFFAVSAAMLGMTAGAITVYLKPRWFAPDRVDGSLAKACVAYGLAVPATVVFLCVLPLERKRSIMSPIVVVIATAATSLPFYFAGIVVSAALTKYDQPIGLLYGCDLLGAALGCLFVLGGLEVLDAPSLMILCGALGIAAASTFGREAWDRRRRRACHVGLVALTLIGLANSATTWGIRPFVVKGVVKDPGSYFIERWNSHSTIVMWPEEIEAPQYWGPSPRAPQERIHRHVMNIDGGAGTTMRRFHSNADIEHLRFDVTNVAYFLRPRGGACIIGVGGGKDIQSALLFGHERVVGIDVNPIFIDLIEGPFRKFAGIADHAGVRLVVDEARSHLTRSDERFALIQMSLIDTWAATGAGAFSLSENALYTVEGWHVFLDRLSPGGVFTVSRWHSPTNIGETGRVLSLAVATLLERGVREPARHLALVTVENVSTLIVSNDPLTDADVQTLARNASDLEYEVVLAPDRPPKSGVLAAIAAATSREALAKSVADQPLNYAPTTDENPYFFNMLRLTHLPFVLASDPGVLRGNLTATVTLLTLILALLVVSLATIVLPLLLPRLSRSVPAVPVIWSAAGYFALIGCGFMFIEIALIQRLSVFLGRPVYGLGVLLFGIIASSGVGSLVSERLPLERRPWLYLAPVVTAAAIVAIRHASSVLMSEHITDPTLTKVALSVALIFPLGLLLGVFFPTGMRLAQAAAGDETPWYWAINGITGVLCSAVAVFVSIYAGISTNFYLSAACYTALLLCLARMSRLGLSVRDS